MENRLKDLIQRQERASVVEVETHTRVEGGSDHSIASLAVAALLGTLLIILAVVVFILRNFK